MTIPVDVLRVMVSGDTPLPVAGSAICYTRIFDWTTYIHSLASNSEIARIPAIAGSYPALDTYLTTGIGSSLLLDNPAPNTPINLFIPGRSTIPSLPVGTYELRAFYSLRAFAAPVAAVPSLLFGGTATYSAFNYTVLSWITSSFSGVTLAPVVTAVSTNAATVVDASNALLQHYMSLSGVFTVSAPGSFIPQIRFSASKGANSFSRTPSMYLELVALGAGFTSQGGWV